jgi:hypothetical protein
MTLVVARELWIFLPWGAWQYFCIGDDTITEIVDDTGKVPGTHQDPAGEQGKPVNQPQSGKPTPGSREPGPAGAGAQEAGSPGP